jgi:hypothetical protein
MTENPYQPPSSDGEAALSPPPPEEPMAIFESANRRMPESKRWKVRLYRGGLHVAPGLGENGFWVSRNELFEQGNLLLGLINALYVPLPKKTTIPIDADARRVLRRWLHPDEGRMLARVIGRQRIWLLMIGVVWLWAGLPSSRHGLQLLELVAGGLALATALVGLVRPARLVFLGEGAWVCLWMVTLVRQLLDGRAVGLNVFFLILALPWMGSAVAQFRFFGPPPEDPSL